jgi:tRNA (Thr-GGU) A37 N-methylase
MIERIELCPIGVVETASEQEANIRVFPEFCAGHRDIKDFSHLLILYWRRRLFVISAQKEV